MGFSVYHYTHMAVVGVYQDLMYNDRHSGLYLKTHSHMFIGHIGFLFPGKEFPLIFGLQAHRCECVYIKRMAS